LEGINQSNAQIPHFSNIQDLSKEIQCNFIVHGQFSDDIRLNSMFVSKTDYVKDKTYLGKVTLFSELCALSAIRLLISVFNSELKMIRHLYKQKQNAIRSFKCEIQKNFVTQARQ
jgi:hypothetical protein